MWIKVSAGILFILGGMFCGFSMADKLKKGVEFCTEAEKLLNICESEIRTSNSDVYSIVRRLKKELLKQIEEEEMNEEEKKAAEKGETCNKYIH